MLEAKYNVRIQQPAEPLPSNANIRAYKETNTVRSINYPQMIPKFIFLIQEQSVVVTTYMNSVCSGVYQIVPHAYTP